MLLNFFSAFTSTAITYEFNGKIGPYDMISLYEHDYNDYPK